MAKIKPRNGGKWTEAKYWKEVERCLRDKFRWYSWIPAKLAVMRHERYGRWLKPSTGRWNKTTEFQCQICKQWFFRLPKELVTIKMEVDHIDECGSIRQDPTGWLERLTCEDTFKFQPLCRPCHHKKTKGVKVL